MLTNAYDLNVNPGGVDLIVPVSQYDVNSRQITFNLYADDGTLALPSGVSAAIRGTKPDGNGFDYTATISGTAVTIDITEQMTAVAGRVRCEIYLYKGTAATTEQAASPDYQQLSSANFIMMVERAALDKDTLVSGSEIRQLVDVIDRTDEIIEAGERCFEAEERIKALEDQAAATTQALAGKLNVKQDSGDIGKALVVGPGGNVITGEAGIPTAVKTALLNLLQHVGYTDAQGQTYYDALALALNGDEVTSLTAVYSPGSFKARDGDTLNVLRPYLTVTAHYYSGSSETVQNYTLRGTLTTGTRTITAEYMGATATFTVTVESGGRTYIANFDFTTSMEDLAGNYTPELSAGDGYQAPTRTSEGLKFTQPTQRLYIGEIDPVGKTFEFDVADFDFKGNSDYHMRLFLCCNKKTTPNMFGMSPFVFKANTGYNGYAWTNGLADLGRSWSAQPWSGLQGESARSIINGKTVKLVFEDNHTVALYIGGQSYGKQTDIYYNDQGVVSDILRNCKHISFGSNGSGESSGDQCYDLTLSGFRVYENETPDEQILYDWDFTQSLTDSVSGAVAVTTAQRSSSGLAFTELNTYLDLGTVYSRDRTYEIDVDYINAPLEGSAAYRRFFAFGAHGTDTSSNTSGLVVAMSAYRPGWYWYLGTAWDSDAIGQAVSTVDSYGYFNGKTVKIYIDATGYGHVYAKTIGDPDSAYVVVGSSHGALDDYSTSSAHVYVGSSVSDRMAPARIKAIRIYEGEK